MSSSDFAFFVILGLCFLCHPRTLLSLSSPDLIGGSLYGILEFSASL